MTIGSLLSIVLVLALIGFILWLILTYIPMPAPFKSVITVVVVILLVIWLISATGLLSSSTPIFHRG